MTFEPKSQQVCHTVSHTNSFMCFQITPEDHLASTWQFQQSRCEAYCEETGSRHSGLEDFSCPSVSLLHVFTYDTSTCYLPAGYEPRDRVPTLSGLLVICDDQMRIRDCIQKETRAEYS